ncbi:MAG: NAD(P)H-dependent oxidoreductase subunit E [Spirochaetes bacterium]|nr:NAD(P)H-dependent oxidoreductase subunit E [Spirochaetota bacterium]
MPIQLLNKFDKVFHILENHQQDKKKLIPILQAVQEEYQYLPKEVLRYIATALDISPAKIFGVASFYAHFSLKPKGKYVIKLCDGTACHVKNSHGILEALYDHLGLNEENNTTKDMLFTVETVSCLGACGIAPVMLINENVFGQISPQQAISEVNKILTNEKEGLK